MSTTLAHIREQEDLKTTVQMRSDAVVCQAASALVSSFVALLRHSLRSMRKQEAINSIQGVESAIAVGSEEPWAVEFVRRSEGYR